MKDRVPLYPGRVKLVPVSGQENTYDMVRADEPTQEGTPLSKATFLKDATASLFGLGADAVPDDVLEFLGKYNQYWWKRRVYTVAYEISLSTSLDKSGSPYTDSANAQKVSTYPVKTIGEWVYIMSSDRNAYPDSGITGGYEYQYLGVPFENAVTAVQIATGSYVGTGTYGASNPNSLTFDFVPKLVIVSGQGNSSNYGAGFIYCWGSKKYTLIYAEYSGARPSCVVSLADKTMNWYDTKGNYYQCNDSGHVFNYIAIG